MIEKNGYYYDVYFKDSIYSKITAVNQIASNEVFVGDFVQVATMDDTLDITKVLERNTLVSKESSTALKAFHERKDEQILATNVDSVFILIAADQRFTIGKLERYILTFKKEDIELSVIITKSDFEDKADEIRNEILKYYPNMDILLLSQFDENSIDKFKALVENKTVSILLGASGVGKSTLFNTLFAKEDQNTQDVRVDGKGKHTTTSTRMLYNDELDAYIIDTPGFKTISAAHQVDENILFSEIQEFAQDCKFRDCTHSHEPGCAVKKAIDDGVISEAYYGRYLENKRIIKGQERHQLMKERMKNK
ncbi:ribosome small subunit-dependent GTPase A [Salinicoccus sesuvii]